MQEPNRKYRWNARVFWPWFRCHHVTVLLCLLGLSSKTFGASISKISVENSKFSLSIHQETTTSLGFEFALNLDPEAEWKRVAIIRRDVLSPTEIQYQLEAPEETSGFFRLIIDDQAEAKRLLSLNEIMSNNQSTLADDDGDFSDWIELYNPSDETVSLEQWYLSDDLEELQKWRFPARTIEPKSYLLVFASGKNRPPLSGPLHTNFRISADGESILLSYGENQLIDQITLGRLENDESLGKIAESADDWQVYSPAFTSPAQPNLSEAAPPFIVAPQFTPTPGRHTQGVLFEIAAAHTGQTIFYTTDGSAPSQDSLSYQTPFPINETTVIRAITIDQVGNSSHISTGSYLIGTNHTLPIISLAANPQNFDIRDGFLYGLGEHMYQNGRVTATFPYSASNAWKDREIAASFELFDENSTDRFQQDIGLKIFGGWGSRGYPQKSFAIFARSKYGPGKIRYPLFPNLGIESFESFILRNSGNDNQSTHHIPPRPPISNFGPTQGNGSYFVNSTFTLFRDAMMQSLASNLEVDTQAYRPTILYLNGNYWGIYNLREKLNEHYVESHHDVPSEKVDLIEGYSQANSGSNRFYRSMQSFVSRTDLSIDEHFTTVATQYINIPSFIDYHLSVIYFQNFDIGNIKQWRSQDDGTFRWMLYDQDYGFNLWPETVYLPAMARDYSDYDNMFAFYTNPEGTGTGWPNASGRTRLLRRLLLNESFKTSFITRCLDLLNQDFTSKRATESIRQMAASLRPEIAQHLTRWSWESLQERNHGTPFKPEDSALTKEHWENNVQELITFANQRPEKLRSDLAAHFDLEAESSQVTIQVAPLRGGSIHLNSLTINSSPWTGVYLNALPIALIAEPAPGYIFSEWSGPVTEANQAQTTLSFNSESPLQVTAHFIKQ